jgi:hypothetical protein
MSEASSSWKVSRVKAKTSPKLRPCSRGLPAASTGLGSSVPSVELRIRHGRTGLRSANVRDVPYDVPNFLRSKRLSAKVSAMMSPRS